MPGNLDDTPTPRHTEPQSDHPDTTPGPSSHLLNASLNPRTSPTDNGARASTTTGSPSTRTFTAPYNPHVG